jgi:WD40 repeat protein
VPIFGHSTSGKRSRLLSGHEDGTVALWDYRDTGVELLCSISAHPNCPTSPLVSAVCSPPALDLKTMLQRGMSGSFYSVGSDGSVAQWVVLQRVSSGHTVSHNRVRRVFPVRTRLPRRFN